MITSRELFDNLYEIYQGYNYFDYGDIILFDYVDIKGYIQTIKYIKDENKIIMFMDE